MARDRNYATMRSDLATAAVSPHGPLSTAPTSLATLACRNQLDIEALDSPN